MRQPDCTIMLGRDCFNNAERRMRQPCLRPNTESNNSDCANIAINNNLHCNVRSQLAHNNYPLSLTIVQYYGSHKPHWLLTTTISPAQEPLIAATSPLISTHVRNGNRALHHAKCTPSNRLIGVPNNLEQLTTIVQI